MFAKTIIDSDAFIDMPTSARLLYYDLGMRADDDGFVNSPKKIMRMIGASEDDMRLLIHKKFIIPFDGGVVVIKHWRIHNYIQKDRYTETKYKTEKAQLTLDENKAYKTPGIIENTQCLQSVYIPVYKPDTQVRLGKDRIDKDNINTSCGDNSPPIEEAPTKPKKSKKPKEPLEPKYPEDNQYYKAALYIRSKVLGINPKCKVPQDNPKGLEKWANEIRLTIESDKRTMDELRQIVTFTYRDSFWCTIVQSPKNLRKNWDKIWAKMIKNGGPPEVKKKPYNVFLEILEEGGLEE